MRSKKRLVCFFLSVSFVYSMIASGIAYGQEADSFTIRGAVKEVTGEPVGAGFTVVPVNQRVPTGWFPSNPVDSTDSQGTYAVTFFDPFGRKTRVGDEIRIAVTDPEGNTAGRTTHVVTATEIDDFAATDVDVLLSGLLVDFQPTALPADGESQSTITVTVQNDEGSPVIGDDLEITSGAGAAVSEVTDNGDGTYTVIYTAPFPSPPLNANTPDTLTVRSTVLNEERTADITLQVVPTEVSVDAEPDIFTAGVAGTGTVSVTVERGPRLVAGESVELIPIRNDGGTDTGQVGPVTDNGDGTYTATYTPATTVGGIRLVATDTDAGVSGETTITINAGPPSSIALDATLTTVSSEETSVISAMVTDVAGNGVGGRVLTPTTSNGGSVGAFAANATTFGRYTATYTAPAIPQDEADRPEAITVSVSDSDVSGQLSLTLTPIPPREVSTLVITGTVLKKGGDSPAAGVNVAVTVGSQPRQDRQTAGNGLYEATLFALGQVVAATGDAVTVTVTDDQGVERGRVDFTLMNEDFGEEGRQLAIVERNVETDIGATNSTLSIDGAILLEDGQSGAPGGLTVEVSSSRGLAGSGATDGNGNYAVEFSDTPPAVVAETDDVLTVTVTGTDGSTAQMTHTLTTGQVEAGNVTIDVETDFPARESRTFVIEGTIFLEDGATPAVREGIDVRVKINDFETTGPTQAGAYQATFVNLGAGILAQTGDVVNVEVTAIGEEGSWTETHQLRTDEVKVRRARVDVTTDLKASTEVLSVTGQVFLEDGTSSAPGALSVLVVNNSRSMQQASTTNSNGTYTVEFAAEPPAVVAAETGDELIVTVTDIDGNTAEATRILTTAEVEGGATSINVETDFPARESRTFVVEGTIFLEDGATPAVRDGISVRVKINDFETIGSAQAGVYQATFVNLGSGILARTGDIINVEVTAIGAEGSWTKVHELKTDEVRVRRARVDVTTDLTITTNVLLVEGHVLNPDGTPAGGDLDVTVFIGDNLPQEDRTDDSGNYDVSLFNFASVAESRDSVRIIVSRPGETAENEVNLTSAQILARRATVDVRFPSVFIDVDAPASLTLDADGQASTDIIATVTRASGDLVSDVTVSASIDDGIGSVTPTARNNGDGTYTVTYTANRVFGSTTIAIRTSAVGSPTERAELTVIDDLDSVVVATAQPLAVMLDEPVTFDGSGSSDNVAIATFSWDFDGDSVEDSTADVVTLSFDTAGVVAAVLTVTDTAGNSASATVEVSVGGLSVSGRVLEADERVLQTNGIVLVRVQHTGLNVSLNGVVRDGHYTAAFESSQTDQMLPGETLLIEALSTADSSIVLGSVTHVLTGPELENSIAEVNVLTDRSSTYTIAGQVYGAGRQPITGVPVSAHGRQSVTTNSGYTLFFDNYLTNPTAGEAIEVIAEIPNEIPRRGVVVAFDIPSRVTVLDFTPIRLGGLSLNTKHYRAFIEKIIGLAIEETEIGQLLGGDMIMAIVRANPALQESLLDVLNLFLPPGLFPKQLALLPDLPRVYDQAENIDLENFGNAIIPSPQSDFWLPGLDVLNAGFPRWLSGDKLDLYLVTGPRAERVEFTLAGPGGKFIEADRVDGFFPHTFQLEEEQGILYLPSWLGLNDDTPQVFSAVTLRYASADLPPPTPPANFGAILQDTVSDVQGQLEVLQEALPAELQADLESLQETLVIVQAEIPADLDLEELITDPTRFQELQSQLPPDLPGQLVEFQDALEDVQPELPVDIQQQLAELQGALNGFEGTLENVLGVSQDSGAENRLIVLPPDAYQQASLQPISIGDEIVWETTVELEPGKIYYYYYDLELIHPAEVNLGGFPEDYTISRWVMHDPRNLQIEDRGIIEAVITREFRQAVAPILDPVLAAVAGGGSIPSVQITPEQTQALLGIVSGESLALYADIVNAMDPMLASVLTAPALAASQSLWVGKFDLGSAADGAYELNASVFDANGTLIDQIDGKSFTADRQAPEAEAVVSAGANSAIYKREDGTYIATALPTLPGATGVPEATLTVSAISRSEPSDLAAYLYQEIRHEEEAGDQVLRTWSTLPSVAGTPTALSLGFLGLPLDQLGFPVDLFNTGPVSRSSPHQVEMLIRGQGNQPGLSVRELGIRAVGIDNVFNIDANAPPIELHIVLPEADTAEVTFIVLGDCNGDGDTDDPFETGPAGEETAIFSDTTDVELTVEITNRTDHPLVAIAVEFKGASGDAAWQTIAILDASDLVDAEAGSEFEVDWSIDDFDGLLDAGDRVMVRAVATNALSISDPSTSIATFTLDPDICPVEPEIVSIKVTAEDLNADSGAVQGTILLNAFMNTRTSPETQAVRFEIRRLQDTDWQSIGEATDFSIVEGDQTAVLENLVGAILGGAPSIPIAQAYRQWSISLDTTTLDDTITNRVEGQEVVVIEDLVSAVIGGASTASIEAAVTARARDATEDENPYAVRAVAVDVEGTEYESADAIQEEFSVDNIDDVPPLSSTEIVQLADTAGVIEAQGDAFLVGGVVYEGFDTPVLTVTAQPTAPADTFAQIDLLINVRNSGGLLGDPVDIGPISFSSSEDGYTATVELVALENGSYFFQALAIDEAGNREERDIGFAIDVDVENFIPPVNWPDPGVDVVSINGMSVAEINAAHPRGFPVADEFAFTLTLPGVAASDIDVFIDGASARDLGLLTDPRSMRLIANGAVIATPNPDGTTSFFVPIDTPTALTPEGMHTLAGTVTKRNGTIGFELPAINVDVTDPTVTILSPLAGHQVSALPTIHVIYDDGTGGGVDPSETSIVVGLIRLMPPEEVPVVVTQSAVHKDRATIVYTRGELLSGGAYRAVIQVTDFAGNATEVSSEFSVVGTLPAVSILSPLPGQILDIAQPLISTALTGAGQISVTMFTIDDSAIPVTPEMLEGNRLSFTPDALADGSHTVTVQIEDGDGKSAGSSVTFTVSTQDTTPPIITQVSPQGTVKSSEATLSAVAFDEQSGIESITLSIDIGDTPVEGPSPLSVTGLTAGSHTVDVVVRNGAGLETPFSWSFIVELDASPPVISTVAPQGIVKEDSVTLSAAVADEQSGVTRVALTIDGPPGEVPEGEIPAPAIPIEVEVLISNGRVSHAMPVTAGAYAVTVVAESAGGISEHTWTFTVELDTTPPVISAVSPHGLVTQREVKLTAMVTDEQSPITEVKMSVNTGTSVRLRTVDLVDGQASKDVVVNEGTHTATVVATSAGGTATHTWTFTADLDTTPPSITATAPHGVVRVEKPKISVTATDDRAGPVAFTVTLKDNRSKTLSGQTKLKLDRTSVDFRPDTALEAGTYTVETTAADVTGNRTSATWSFTVEFDTVAPSITVVAPQGEARVAEPRPTITATYTDNVSGVDVESIKLWVDGDAVDPDKATATQVVFTPKMDLALGRHAVRVEVADLAPSTNRATQEWSFIVESDDGIVDARNFPNPFADSTTIAFTLSKQARVTIEIYDMTSRLVAQLAQDELREAGPAEFRWDGKTTAGGDVLARGVYFCQIIMHSDLKPEAAVLKMGLMREK